jgi:hypothetical protein
MGKMMKPHLRRDRERQREREREREREQYLCAYIDEQTLNSEFKPRSAGQIIRPLTGSAFFFVKEDNTIPTIERTECQLSVKYLELCLGHVKCLIDPG